MTTQFQARQLAKKAQDVLQSGGFWVIKNIDGNHVFYPLNAIPEDVRHRVREKRIKKGKQWIFCGTDCIIE